MLESELERLPWEEVESSNVARLAWVHSGAGRETVNTQQGKERLDVEVGSLYVEFTSRDDSRPLYVYFEVSQLRYERVRDAESVGSMLNKLVKPNYQFEQIVALPDPPELEDQPQELEAPEALQLLTEIRDELKELTRLLGDLRRVGRSSTTGGT